VAAGDLAAEDQGDDVAGHVLVDAGEGVWLDVESGFLADLAAQAIMDGLGQLQDAAGVSQCWLSRRRMSRTRPWSSG
jgi:hypothetical protein